MIAAAWDPNLERLDEAVDHVRGPAEGRLIIEYGDYECPYSRLAFREIERIEQELGEAIRFAYRHFPLVQIHPHAFDAAAAAEAAASQARFWEMHELLFHRQKALEGADLQRYAAQLGLDVARFDDDRQGTAVLERNSSRRRERNGHRQGTRHADAFHRRHPPPRQLRRRNAAERTGVMSSP